MRQRVMIAMALLLEPQVVIMDEPTTALDVVVQREILREIVRLRDGARLRGHLHHPRPAAAAGDQRPDRGHAAGRDRRAGRRADALHRSPQHPYTRQLLASFPSLTGERGGFIRTGGDRADETDGPWRTVASEPMSVWRCATWSRTTACATGCAATRLRAVDQVSFELTPGRTVALVGESGSGKSTIASMLMPARAADVRRDPGRRLDRCGTPVHAPRRTGGTCRWCSRTRSRRSTRSTRSSITSPGRCSSTTRDFTRDRGRTSACWSCWSGSA